MPTLTKFLLTFALSAVLLGCGTYRTPGVSSSNEAEAAMLDVTDAGPTVFVHSIDGKSRGFGIHNSYQMPPGRRVITVLGNTQSGLLLDPTNVVFVAEPRKRYVLVRLQKDQARGWQVMIVEAESGRRVDTAQFPAPCTTTWSGGYECSAEP